MAQSFVPSVSRFSTQQTDGPEHSQGPNGKGKSPSLPKCCFSHMCFPPASELNHVILSSHLAQTHRYEHTFSLGGRSLDPEGACMSCKRSCTGPNWIIAYCMIPCLLLHVGFFWWSCCSLRTHQRNMWNVSSNKSTGCCLKATFDQSHSHDQGIGCTNCICTRTFDIEIVQVSNGLWNLVWSFINDRRWVEPTLMWTHEKAKCLIWSFLHGCSCLQLNLPKQTKHSEHSDGASARKSCAKSGPTFKQTCTTWFHVERLQTTCMANPSGQFYCKHAHAQLYLHVSWNNTSKDHIGHKPSWLQGWPDWESPSLKVSTWKWQ